MVDLRVDVIGAAAHHDDVQPVGAGVVDVFLAGGAYVVDVGLIGLVGGPGGGCRLLFGDAELLMHQLGNALAEVLVPPQAHIGVQETGLL